MPVSFNAASRRGLVGGGEAAEERGQRVGAAEPAVQHVAPDARAFDQGELLEHEADLRPARPVGRAVGPQRPTEHRRRALPAAQPPVEQREQCRLAGAGRADQRHDLAALDRKVDAGERPVPAGAVAVDEPGCEHRKEAGILDHDRNP